MKIKIYLIICQKFINSFELDELKKIYLNNE